MICHFLIDFTIDRLSRVNFYDLFCFTCFSEYIPFLIAGSSVSRLWCCSGSGVINHYNRSRGEEEGFAFQTGLLAPGLIFALQIEFGF